MSSIKTRHKIKVNLLAQASEYSPLTVEFNPEWPVVSLPKPRMLSPTPETALPRYLRKLAL